eukprot:scaffold204550_cov48-Attheya_sp.AAC.1
MSKKSTCTNVNLTRSSGIKPRCSNYGRYRHAFYRRHGFFFCNACVLYDSVVEKSAVNSESRRYKCTAGHTSFIFPTTRIKNSTYRSSQQIYNRRRIWKAPVEEGNESETECLSSEEEEEAESSDEEEEVRQGFISSPFESTQRVLANEFSPEFLQQQASIAATPVYAAACNPQIDLLQAEVSRLKSELEK